MIRRCVSTLAAAVLGLVLLAWPYSAASTVCIIAPVSARQYEFGLTRSQLMFRSFIARKSLPLERDRFYFSGPSTRDEAAVFWPRINRLAGSFFFTIPLAFLAAASSLLLVATVSPKAIITRRRAARGRCIACGYEHSGPQPCPECGLTPAQTALRKDSFGRTARDAGAVILATLFLLSGAAWLVVRADGKSAAVSRAQSFDYSWYLDTCSPHLKGSVAYATPGGGPTGLGAVLSRSQPGATIVLLPGAHDLGGASAQPTSATGIRDVWLIGSGQTQTTLSLHLSTAERLRLQNMTIDCKNDPLVDLRTFGSLYLRACLIKGYNSGAGGSSAMDISNGIVLVEECEFEGKSGRNGPSSHGTAMDLRGDTRVYVRGTRFTNNQEVFRNAMGVLDGCTATTDQPQWFWPPMGGGLLQRNVKMGTGRPGMPAPASFVESLDDLPALERLAKGEGAKAWSDPAARAQARVLGVGQPAFWARLLLHPSPEVRALARAKTGQPVTKSSAMTLQEALETIANPRLAADAALAILAEPESARAPLEELRASGTDPARSNADALLILMDAQPPLPDLVRAEVHRTP